MTQTNNFYKKKPVVIEAIQWSGENNINAIIEWLGDNLISEESNVGTVGRWIKTLEGNMMISYGDYIIKGVNGEFYPCKPDIFEKTYEKVAESSKEIADTVVTDEEIDNFYPIKSEYTALTMQFTDRNKARREGAKWMRDKLNIKDK